MSFIRQSASREEALFLARRYFQYAAVHLLGAQWRKNAIQDFGFYDGTGQMPEHYLAKLRDRGQDPVIINKVKPLINQMSGVEIQSRFRNAFRSHSGSEEDERLAKAISHYYYYIQEHNDAAVKQSQKYRDMLVCGLGWSNMYSQNNRIYYDYVHPLNILYDADDFSPLMTDQQYVICMHWVSEETAKMLWPKYSKDIENLFAFAEPANVGSVTSEWFSRISEYVDQYAIGGGGVGARILVIEIQRKQKRNYFCGNDHDGKYFETFDEKLALEFTDGKEDEVYEEKGHQILRTLFCRDIVFEHGLLNPNIPNGTFTYTPGIYSRRASDGIPVGWLEQMKDVQRVLNYTKTKEMAMLNSTRAIVDLEAIPQGVTLEQYREELSRNDSILVKPKEANISLHPNIDLAASQINMSRRLDEELQQVSGMFSDALGQASNATSGVAINSRARLSMTNQRVGLDHLELMKKREGRLFLDILQCSNTENIMSHIVDEDEKEIIILNLTRTVDGKKVVFNDIRNLPISIYVEQTHDYESAPEEQRATFEALLGNPNAQMILQSPAFLKLLGMRDWQKISDEMTKISQEKQQNENMTANNIPSNMMGANQGMSPANGEMGPNPMQIRMGGR